MEKESKRRDFLKLTMLGLVTAASSGAAASAQARVAGEKEEPSSGYRETEHVRKYYDLARF